MCIIDTIGLDRLVSRNAYCTNIILYDACECIPKCSNYL